MRAELCFRLGRCVNSMTEDKIWHSQNKMTATAGTSTMTREVTVVPLACRASWWQGLGGPLAAVTMPWHAMINGASGPTITESQRGGQAGFTGEE